MFGSKESDLEKASDNKTSQKVLEVHKIERAKKSSSFSGRNECGRVSTYYYIIVMLTITIAY